MIEGLPWQGWLGILGTSISLNATFVWMVFTGRVITRREADEKNATVTALRKQNAEQGEQIGLLLNSSVPATNAVMNALHQALDNGGA